MKFTISLPDDLMQKVDAEMKIQSINRSAFIGNALREYLANLEAKRMLPKLQAVLEIAAAGKDLPEDMRKQLDAFDTLSSLIEKN